MFPAKNLQEYDLREICERTRLDHEEFRDARVLILGGSGFLGSWLIESLLYINNISNLRLQVHAPVRSREKLQHLTSQNLFVSQHNFLTGNFRGQCGNFDFVFHALTPTTSNLYDQILKITKKLFEDIGTWSVKPRFVHLSSGAVYPKKILSQGPVNEQEISLSRNLSEYGKLKWSLENEIKHQTKLGSISGISPRLFAFAGPRIPLDAHFAIGNFMQQGLRREEVIIKGNSNTVRSYLYPVDAIIWLLRSAVNPTSGILHVGSSKAYTMLEIAHEVANAFGVNVIESSTEEPSSIYLPSNEQTKSILNVREEVNLQDSILRWKKWLTEKD